MVAVDKLATAYPSVQATCYTEAFDITPSDTVQLPFVTRAIYVGGGGNIEVIMKSQILNDGTSHIFYNVPAGTVLPIRALQVRMQHTTATLLTGLI